MRAFLPVVVLSRLYGPELPERGAPMRTRSSVAAAVAAIAAAVPATASAAQVQVDQACYQDNTGTVALTGNGFDASQPYQVALDGKALKGSGTTGPDGSIAGS